jgi:hypothetical protein
MGNIADLSEGNLQYVWQFFHNVAAVWLTAQHWVASVWQSIPLTHTETVWTAIGLGALVLFLLLWRYLRYLKRQGKILLEPGKFGELPGFIPTLIAYIIIRIYVRFMMGKVTMIGRRNLWYPGRLITFGPHISYLHDAPLSLRAMKLRRKRFFIAREEAMGNRERIAKAGAAVRFFDGLRTPLLAFTGGIVVDRGNSEATKAAFKSGLAAMDIDGISSFILFPEGKVREQAKLLPENHFTGAVRLLQTIKKPPLRRKFPWIVKPRPPAILQYGVYLDFDWSHATWTHRFIVEKLGFKNFRRVKGGNYLVGAYVCYATPQDEESLERMVGGSSDARLITDRLTLRNEHLRQHCIRTMRMRFGEDIDAAIPAEEAEETEVADV